MKIEKSEVLSMVKGRKLEYDVDDVKDDIDEIMEVFDFYEIDIDDYHRRRITTDLLETVERITTNRNNEIIEELTEEIDDYDE